jgi:hypothetical protein
LHGYVGAVEQPEPLALMSWVSHSHPVLKSAPHTLSSATEALWCDVYETTLNYVEELAEIHSKYNV